MLYLVYKEWESMLSVDKGLSSGLCIINEFDNTIEGSSTMLITTFDNLEVSTWWGEGKVLPTSVCYEWLSFFLKSSSRRKILGKFEKMLKTGIFGVFFNKVTFFASFAYKVF